MEASLRTRVRSIIFRTSLLGLVTLSVVTCTADSPESTGAAEQAVINPPLPSNLNVILNAKTTVTIGAFTQVRGDVASVGVNGSVLFDVSATQGFGSFNVLANTVTVNINASVGHVFGNDITVNGFASQQSLGLDPSALPPVPTVTPATPGSTNVSTNANQAKQLCPGQYGAITLGTNSTLNLNGGVYQVTRLNLGDGARLEPSEPVVILVSGGVTTGIGAFIRPSAQALNPMTAASIRIEVGGAVTLGDSTQVRAHVLTAGKFTTGKNLNLTGAAWAKTINIGTQGFVAGEGVFAAQAPSVPPPCNDNSACTVDQCVGGGTAVGFCRNTPVAVGTSCGDGNTCNGAELCDAAGQCQPGTNAGAGTSCADGDLCDGDETCTGSGACVAGPPPVVNDDNSCTADACDPATGVAHIPLPDGSACNGAGTCTAGVCSVLAHNLVMINDVTGHLERLDPDTLETTDIGPLGVPYAFGDCMFNPADGKLYMVDGRGAESLYTVDLATGAASLVGFHGNSAMEGLAFHPPTNKIFGTSFDDVSLFTLSATTGAATFVGGVGGNRFQGLAWDSTRNVMTAFNGSQIFSVNVTNAALTLLAFTEFVGNYGMTYDPVIDRFWVVDTSGRVLQLDPNQGFITTLEAFIGGAHTCVAEVPVAVGR
jgi:hypothetical protein